MIKKILFTIVAIFMLILTIQGAMAQPPQTSVDSEQFNIVYPKEEFYKSNVEIKPHIHVMSEVGKLLDNNSVVCTYHAYKPNGGHLLQHIMEYDGSDFETTINTSHTNMVGEIPYTIYCENATRGGFASGVMILTPDAKDHSNKLAEVIAVFLIIGAAWLLVMNRGANISGFRRFIGSSMVLTASMGGMYILSLTNHNTEITVEAWLIGIGGVIFFVVQLGIVLRDLILEYLSKDSSYTELRNIR